MIPPATLAYERKDVILENLANAIDERRLDKMVEQSFPEVSQFGSEGKEAFLEHPVFSRDYTGQ